MALTLQPIDRPNVPPKPISARLRTQLVYFASPADAPGVPPLGENEYWFDPTEIDAILDDGALYLVSPLDTANKTEVELSEEQEAFLQWLKDQGVRHARVVET